MQVWYSCYNLFGTGRALHKAYNVRGQRAFVNMCVSGHIKARQGPSIVRMKLTLR